MTGDDKRIHLVFTGDVSFGDCLFCQGMGIRSLARKYPKEHFFAGVSKHIREADLAFCNLETVLSRSGEDERSLATVDMRGDPEAIGVLKAAGFSVVNFANNHAAQHGPVPFRETVDLLAKHELQVVGLKGEKEWHCAPVVLERRGKKIGLLGYSFVHDRLFATATPYAEGDMEKILGDIRRLRDSVDLLVASVHWGLEFLDYPSARTAGWGRAMVDAGADAVIGHHPHVLQGVEVYRDKIIAYSLGNFLFDMLWSEEYRETMMLELWWTPGEGVEWDMVPARIGNDGRVSVVTGSSALRARERMDSLCRKIRRGHEEGFPGESAYQKEYDRKNNAGRLKSYLYFLMNFHKYRKRYLLQQIRRTIGSRVEDLRAILGQEPP